jgi:hypothetical protein
MKPLKPNHIILTFTLLALLSTLNLQLSTVFAQGTAFTDQGQLQNNGSPATGIYDLRFTIYDAVTNGNLIAGPLTNSATGVTNGLFTVTLNFGSGVFTGPARWLELDVRTNGPGSPGFTTLSPRQPILPTPYAIMANAASNLLGTLPAAQLSGTLPSSVLAGYSGTVTLTNGGNSFNGSFSGSFGGSGAGLTGVPGTFTWQNVTGTSQQAQPNTGYLANNAAQVTITLPTGPNLGDIVRVSGVGAGGWIIAQNAGQAIEAAKFGAVTTTNWNSLTNWTQTSAPVKVWESVASSADGTKLAAACQWDGSSFSGCIYTSTNSGVTWTQTSAPSTNWMSIASSTDGTKLAAVVSYGGGIYISTNSGVTWIQTSAPNENWWFIASSADGTKLAAVVDYGGIYTSTNSGVAWTQTSAPIIYWSSIASSADGTQLAAVDGATGGIYTSTNSGLTWTRTSASGLFEGSIASSADGTKLAAAANGGEVYTSTNSGVTWTQQTSVPMGCDSIASAADGTKLAVAGTGGIYTSTNSGVTWTQTSGPAYGAVTSSADGTKLVAGCWGVNANGGGIWTAQATIQTTTTPGTAGYLTGGQNSAIELQYIGNGQFMPLSYVGTISAY